MDQQTRSSDEKMWASIAHAVFFLNIVPQFTGLALVLTMGIWVFKRKASSYTGYQALQAFVFQAAVLLFALLVLSIAPAGFFLIMLAGSGYAIYGAYRCHQGLAFSDVGVGTFLSSLRPKQ